MRIKTNFFASLDGFVSSPDGRPVAHLLPGFTGGDSYGLSEFLAGCEAVVLGRTTFLAALGAPRWPWSQPVFVLTSSPLPDGSPDGVTAAASVVELLELLQTAGVVGDVNLVGGPSTMHAFREAGALDELWLHVVPMLLGSGQPLSPPGTEPLALNLRSTRTFPDGVIELGYGLGEP